MSWFNESDSLSLAENEFFWGKKWTQLVTFPTDHDQWTASSKNFSTPENWLTDFKISIFKSPFLLEIDGN